MSRAQWIAWAVLLFLSGATLAAVGLHAAAGPPGDRLCAPAGPAVIKLTQNKGDLEKGSIYLDFTAARQARDGLDQWLHTYGRCP